MTTAATWRALAPTEKIYADKEMYSGYTFRASGRLDADALATAYEAVCRAYPQLSCRLESRGDQLVLVEADTPPELRLVDGDPDDTLTGAEFDPQRALSALNVVRDGSEASVSLLNHHAIADAGHTIGVFVALWSFYTDIVHGVPFDLPRQPYPKSLEEILTERGIRPPAGGASPGSVAVTDQSAPERFELIRRVVQHRLTASRTTALADLGHREGVTINSLLSGAILLAEAEVRDLPLNDMLFRFAINLRNRLTPPVGPTEATNALGSGTFRPTDEVRPDAVSIGRAIGERLRAGFADGSLQRSMLDIVYGNIPPVATDDPPAAVVSMTNPGIVPATRTPDDLRLTNFHSTTRIKVPPEEFAANGGYIASTLDGRLSIDLAWADGDPDLPRRLDCLRDQVDRLTRQT